MSVGGSNLEYGIFLFLNSRGNWKSSYLNLFFQSFEFSCGLNHYVWKSVKQNQIIGILNLRATSWGLIWCVGEVLRTPSALEFLISVWEVLGQSWSNPSDSKSNRLYVEIFQVCFIHSKNILQILLKWSVILLNFWTPISQTQPVHL